jgi:hypothetical protein
VPRLQVVVGSAGDGRDVEAGVRVEAAVLDGDGGLDHDRRDLVEPDRQAVVSMVTHVGEDHSSLVGDDGVARESGAV